MEGKESFGKYILKKRKEAGLSQKALAEQLFVTESAVSKWERGISYPDITLVAALCELLHISEHELVTASDDYRQKETEKQARHYRRLTKGYAWTLYILYGAAILTCFICNIAIFHTLSWFFIVLTAIMTAFSLTNLPMLLTKHKGLYTLLAFFGTLNLLLLTCCIYTGGDWFLTAFAALLFSFCVVFLPFVLRDINLPKFWKGQKALLCFIADTLLLFLLIFVGCRQVGYTVPYILQTAFPVGASAAIAAWIYLIVIRYIRCNGFFKTSICCLFTGVYTFFYNNLLLTLLDHEEFQVPAFNLRVWNMEYINANILLIILLAGIAAALLFAIGGVVSTIKKNRTEIE